MTLSKAQLEVLQAAYAAGSKGLIWFPARLAWFTREGKRLRSRSVLSLTASGLLKVICLGGTIGMSQDISSHSFIAVVTAAAAKLISKRF